MKRFQSKKGVTLIELLVSIAILALIATPFLTTMISATKNNLAARDKSYASSLAQKAIDEIKSDSGLLTATDPEKELTSEDGFHVYYSILQIGQNQETDDQTNPQYTYLYKINVNIKKDNAKSGGYDTVYSLISYGRK